MTEFAALAFDLEANGLDPTEIFVLGVLDITTNRYESYTGDDIPAGLLRLADADILVGHYARHYDAPVIERLTDGLITIDGLRLVDTHDLSRRLFPGLRNHKLRTWGEILDFPKGDYTGGFSAFDPDMIPYCERDVRLTAALFVFLGWAAGLASPEAA